MIVPAFVVALCATAAAQDEKCQSASAGYYATAGLPDYDHDRFGTSTDEGDFRIDFQGFISSFDGSDDDTGDGASDLLMLPEWVAYEMRFFGDVTAGFKLAPGWARPSPWYEHEDLVADRPGQELLDESYKGEAHI